MLYIRTLQEFNLKMAVLFLTFSTMRLCFKVYKDLRGKLKSKTPSFLHYIGPAVLLNWTLLNVNVWLPVFSGM